MLTKNLKTKLESITSMNDVKIAWDILRGVAKRIQTEGIHEFSVGEKVYFRDRRGGLIIGKVTKINVRTVGVDAGAQGKWRVAPSILQKYRKQRKRNGGS